MEIIYLGKLPGHSENTESRAPVHKFSCPHCHTIFVAEHWEYEVEEERPLDRFLNLVYYTRCPLCEKQVRDVENRY